MFHTKYSIILCLFSNSIIVFFSDNCIEKEAGSQSSSSKVEDSDYHRSDEQVNILLEAQTTALKQMRRKFIRCSAQVTVTHLKKFIAKKVFNNMDKYREVSSSYLLCIGKQTEHLIC